MLGEVAHASFFFSEYQTGTIDLLFLRFMRECKSNYSFGPATEIPMYYITLLKEKGQSIIRGKLLDLKEQEISFLLNQSDLTFYQADSQIQGHLLGWGSLRRAPDYFAPILKFLTQSYPLSSQITVIQTNCKTHLRYCLLCLELQNLMNWLQLHIMGQLHEPMFHSRNDCSNQKKRIFHQLTTLSPDCKQLIDSHYPVAHHSRFSKRAIGS